MKNTKFVVKVNRGGTHAPEYVRRVDPTPIHMTTDRKLALAMRTGGTGRDDVKYGMDRLSVHDCMKNESAPTPFAWALVNSPPPKTAQLPP